MTSVPGAMGGYDGPPAGNAPAPGVPPVPDAPPDLPVVQPPSAEAPDVTQAHDAFAAPATNDATVPQAVAAAPADGDVAPEAPVEVTSPNFAAASGQAASAPAPEPAVADPPLPTVLPEVATAPIAPVPYVEEPVVTPPMPMDPIFRDSEQTRIDAVTDEERKLAAERAARREARIRALSAPEPEAAVAAAAPPPVVVTQRSTDKFIPSLGLLILRIVMAGIFGLRGFALLANKTAAETVLKGTVLPQPEIWVLVAGIASMAVALGLLLGLLTRVAGLGATLISGGALAFVMWGPTWSPFDTSPTGFLVGQYAFLGEFELLAAVVGFMLLCVGGGGISIDRAFRASRQSDKTE